jgi:hypothetical protein
MNDDAARAVFLAGLPTGDKGELIPGHTEWEDLGPKAKERYRRMAQAAGPVLPGACNAMYDSLRGKLHNLT